MTQRMREQHYMRCLCNISRTPGIADLITNIANQCNVRVVYYDEAAEPDDLDYADRVEAYAKGYTYEHYRYHCGSLWANREQNLSYFWNRLMDALGDGMALIPVIFTQSTISDDRFD